MDLHSQGESVSKAVLASPMGAMVQQEVKASIAGTDYTALLVSPNLYQCLATRHSCKLYNPFILEMLRCPS